MRAGMTESKPRRVGIGGVRIDVFIEGMSVERDADGFIPNLLGMHKEVNLLIDAGAKFFGFSVDGKKNITPAKNYSNFANAEDKIYRKKIPIHYTRNDNEAFTLYHENHLRLLWVSNDGHFAIYEVAIVFQNGFGFLTIQQVYGGCIFRNGPFLSCPKFDEKWPQLIDFIGFVSQQTNIRFPNLGDGEVEIPNTERLDDNVGVVNWFNVAQGFGAISTNKGDAFVHYKDIDSEERLIQLDAGDHVLFEKLIPNAYIKTGFAYKAVGVLAPVA